MEIIFLLGSVQAFFFASLFFSRKNNILSHQVLIIFFILNGLLLLDHFLELKGIVFDYPHLLGLTYTLPIIVGPILFFYVLLLIKNDKASFKKYFSIHALPFVFLTGYFLLDYYFLSADQKLDYYYKASGGNPSIVIYVTEFFLNFSIPVYSVLSLFHLRKHRIDIRNRFSNIEDISLKWLSIILYCFIGISAVALITHLLSDIIRVMPFLMGDNLMFGALTISIFFIGYYGIRQKAIYSDIPVYVDKKQYKKSGLKADAADYESYLNQLSVLMMTEKLYRNSNLSLKELAGKLNLSANNLSQLINEGLGKSFYEFVNEYRVEEVRHMMKNPEYKHYSLLGIALECGFNSKSSFNSIFKQQTGMTPSEYKKSVS